MKIVVNHDTCQHGGPFADRCLAATIRYPLGHERYCTAEVTDDGQKELTIELIIDGKPHTLTFNTELQREIAATWGVTAFTDPGALAI